MDLKAGPFSGSAAVGDPAIVNLDNSVNHGEAEPRSFSRSLGGEERLEDLFHGVFVHTVAGIRDAEQDSFP